MAHDLYRQVSLDGKPKSIRVLQLSTAQTQPLQGHLKEVSLSAKPKYYALSYTWGACSEPPDRILCHAPSSSGLVSAYVEITANCCDALTQLRRDLSPRGRPVSFNIWVDAVCIDQSANGKREKLGQIPLMREIYAKSERVYIWLGLGTESSTYAMNWISNASQGEYPLTGVKFRNFPANMVGSGELAKLVRLAPEIIKAVYHRRNPRPATMEYQSRHFQDIFRRPWFTRMWTVQELVMASQPIVVCGSKSMRWNSFFWGMVKAYELERNSGLNSFLEPFNSLTSVTSFWFDLYSKEEFSQPVVRIWANNISQPLLAIAATRFLDFLENYGRYALYIQSFLAIAIVLGRLVRGLRPLNSVWIVLFIFSTGFTLFFMPGSPSNRWMERFHGQLIDVFNTTRYRQASEPQDKVYALYGVLASFDIDLPPLMMDVPFEEVYLDFTTRIIKWHRSLDILREVGKSPAAGESSLQNTPSWVPDWRWPLARISLRKRKAAKESSPYFEFLESERQILTKGIFVDTVDSVTCIPVNLRDLGDDETARADLRIHSVMESIIALRAWIQSIRPPRRLIARVPLEKAVFEILHSSTDPALYNSDKLRDTFDRWYAMVIADYPAPDASHSADGQRASDIAEDDVVYSYHRRLLKSMSGRRLFTTKQGYIGTGRQGMEIGDFAVLITGLGLPMIVRGKGEQGYMVVGAAHIHGVMEGEEWPSDEGNLRDIVLI